ncbi:hypothetical protein L226DRAFT_264597 [Lentinus tigrinus ALCF2SS1-7]|uniref:Uncharacterized protein n=1 Tax=Lentinus tigrinus ALCF2SS1-6 TaxID=1328759 RepID=A0A5C2S6W8_9APHY|nr:hypothetical protein L227DRAFT_177425 [Lentinus tigrinus ALCF2SS1-6]RPD69788.1 hypothetical protein L226DRAFT_264597 [Lentinus tigrinus ALCF2SS1-7]
MFHVFFLLALATFAHALSLPKNLTPTFVRVTGKPAGLAPTSSGIDFPSSMPRGDVLTHPTSHRGLFTNKIATTPGGAMRNATGDSLTSFTANAASQFPATLLLCQSNDCASCLGFDLSSASHATCLDPAGSTFVFQSAAISQESDSGLGFAVEVSPGGCASFSTLPRVNTCIPLSGTFAEFALVDPS